VSEASPGRAPLSVVVCTLDEEATIARCLRSVSWADELVVLDSGSTDRTREIAASCGARVHEQPWLGFSAQKNHAAGLAAHDWILSLDADEVVTDALGASIRAALSDPRLDPRAGFSVNRRSDFLGVLLPNGARRAKRLAFVRLYNRAHGGWDETMVVHEAIVVPGERRMLAGDLLHLNDIDIDAVVAAFNRYATVEAKDLHDRGRRTTALEVVLRPAGRFLWQYLFRGEFRLGAIGAVHAALDTVRELVRYAKLWELQRDEAPRR
jgi:(heptosyl)LPS beta-1,4-glucosyltransferase